MNRGNSRAEPFCDDAENKAFKRVLGDRLARNMRDALPSALFIGFTGPPIEQNNVNSRAVFNERTRRFSEL